VDYLLLADQHSGTKLPKCLQNFTAVLPLREKLSNTEFLTRAQFHGIHACTMYVNIEHVFIFGLNQESYRIDRFPPTELQITYHVPVISTLRLSDISEL